MKQAFVLFAGVALALTCRASWYWPFGSDETEDEPPRLSVLMQPASDLIDEASDLAYEGKSREAVEKYRAALAALDTIEAENPERAKKTEFATLRNKRAYVNAAIDSLLMAQVQENAKRVAVSDTTELERKLAAEKKAKKDAEEAEKEKARKKAEKKKAEAEKKKAEAEKKAEMEKSKAEKPKAEAAKPKVEAAKPKAEAVKPKVEAAKPKAVPGKGKTLREQAMADIAKGDYAAAELSVEEMLVQKPNNATALNLKAAIQTAQGRYKEAERTLDQAIMSNPRSPFAFYNMARLMLRTGGDRQSARRYYETGRSVGGAKDAELERILK